MQIYVKDKGKSGESVNAGMKELVKLSILSFV